MLEFIGAGTGFILLVVGLLALMKNSIGGTIRGVLGVIPVGNPKLWAIAFVVVGLIVGGFGYGYSAIAGAIGTTHTASFTSTGDTASTGLPGANLQSCYLSTLGATTAVAAGNSTLRSDPNNLAHEYIDVGYQQGAAIFNGTLLCNSGREVIRNGAYSTCTIKGDSFRSETSTTDSNTYYILSTSTSASKIQGLPWAQVAYLKSGGVASTTDDQEQTKLVFAQDVVQQTLGFRFSLPGTTAFSHLNNQTSKNVVINCDGQPVFTFTITKTTTSV